jgi:uncharacterized C2H2 Zn-finger protein
MNNLKSCSSFHENMESTSQKIPCTVCGTSYFDKYNRHLTSQKHKSNEIFGTKNNPSEIRCDLCDTSYVNIHRYNEHLTREKHKSKETPKIKEKPPEIKCDLCNITFAEKRNFVRHFNTNKHRSKIPDNTEPQMLFKCELCNITYNRKDYYNRHVTSNTHILNDPNSTEKIKVYKCEKCNTIYNSQSSYNRHLTTIKHGMPSEEYKEYLKQRSIQANKNGENNELFMLEILETLDFEDIVYTGNTANRFDIFVKFEDEDQYRGLQIKTLSRIPDSNRYKIQSGKLNYEDDTLIVGVSNAKDKYVLSFYRDMKETTYFSTTSNVDKIYDDFDIFKNKLFEMAHTSTIVANFDDYLNETGKLESDSMKRFQHQCNIRSIQFMRNIINSNEIDGVTNNYNLQLKSSGCRKGNNKYQFSLCRRGGGGSTRPYNLNDKVDFFVFEMYDERYQGNFFIVPMKILIQLGYITTVNNNGKFSISVPIIEDYHWSQQYLNRFDQLSINIGIPLIFNYLHKICLSMGLSCEFDRKKIISINAHKIRYSRSMKHNNRSYIFNLRNFKDYKIAIFGSDINYEFVVFEFAYLYQFCIVPVSVLLERGYLVTDDNEGMLSISIPFSMDTKNNWSEFYNNFEQFIGISNNVLAI